MYEEDELLAILEDFRQSWDYAEAYFEANVKANTLYPIPLLQLMRELRIQGYDERFRAYYSLFNFVISSSRRIRGYYARPYIRFFVHQGKLDVQSRIGDKFYRFTLQDGTINTELKILLELLMAQPID
jgi:hypothetical protein